MLLHSSFGRMRSFLGPNAMALFTPGSTGSPWGSSDFLALFEAEKVVITMMEEGGGAYFFSHGPKLLSTALSNALENSSNLGSSLRSHLCDTRTEWKQA